MLKLTAAGFAATTALVLATSGTAHALGDDKPAANRAAAVAKCPTDVRIDETAPVITRKDILIHAPLPTIWKIQTDVEKWPTWQPKAVAAGDASPGGCVQVVRSACPSTKSDGRAGDRGAGGGVGFGQVGAGV
ncbi:hypothetical protein OG765_09195 [Streptomyces sp. NBC_00555]|uniref:hypothetical protein n=1 Tax=Streptomyces sp. NBC_00555 TaxID=2903662 RepID=UPI0022537CE6|nr:hypothetical protein [Streptomyces sp. NBC_00555]MCX5011163.1 hypothetical protein [Streptomyces sp. NBC_00555]